jgi:hypothetical protein
MKNEKKFSDLSDEEQINKMREWFNANYVNPKDACIKDDYGFIFLNGGPYNAKNILAEIFSDIVEKGIIDNLTKELQKETCEWEKRHTYEDTVEVFTEYPIERLINNIRYLSKIIDTEIDETIQRTVFNMIHGHCISALEAFLQEEFLRQILSNEDNLKSFYAKNKDFEKEKFSLSEFFSILPKEKATEYLNSLIWHKLCKVKELYKCTLDINFPQIDFLVQMVKLRHDIVHRCGRYKDGKKVEITKLHLLKLFDEVIRLATFINDKLNGK